MPFFYAIYCIRCCAIFAAGVKGTETNGKKTRCAREYDELKPMARFYYILPGTIIIDADIFQFDRQLLDYSLDSKADVIFAT